MTYALETQIENLRAEVKELRTRLANLLVDQFYSAIDIEEAERRGFEAARELIPDPKHYGAFTVGGPVTKERFSTFNDYQHSKSQEGQS